MTIQNEGVYAAEFLLSEGNGEISRVTVTINTNGKDLKAGTILKESDGTYSAWENGETAKAILYDNVKAGTTKALVIARLAEVSKSCLIFPSEATGYEAGLLANFIVTR